MIVTVMILSQQRVHYMTHLQKQPDLLQSLHWLPTELADVLQDVTAGIQRPVHKYTCQLDIADVIMCGHRNFLCNLWHSPNIIVRHLASVELYSVV